MQGYREHGMNDRVYQIGNLVENLSWNMQGNQILYLTSRYSVNGEQFHYEIIIAHRTITRLNYTTPVAGMNLVLVDTYLQN
jgi:hypothetical protein